MPAVEELQVEVSRLFWQRRSWFAIAIWSIREFMSLVELVRMLLEALLACWRRSMPLVRAVLRVTSEEMVVRHPYSLIMVTVIVAELIAGSTNEY